MGVAITSATQAAARVHPDGRLIGNFTPAIAVLLAIVDCIKF